jgi:hypothetical protein
MAGFKRLLLEKEEMYEIIAGENAINHYTHEEIMDRLGEMYECYAYMCEVSEWQEMREVMAGVA